MAMPPMATGELLETLEAAGAELRIKVQPPAAQGGRFTKADFAIDTEAATVTCPAGRTAPLRPPAPGRRWPASGRPARPVR